MPLPGPQSTPYYGTGGRGPARVLESPGNILLYSKRNVGHILRENGAVKDCLMSMMEVVVGVVTNLEPYR